ncbi:unnamed protein product, partial [Timema podura]|nr:unnamed protein product [Timema podura]
TLQRPALAKCHYVTACDEATVAIEDGLDLSKMSKHQCDLLKKLANNSFDAAMAAPIKSALIGTFQTEKQELTLVPSPILHQEELC